MTKCYGSGKNIGKVYGGSFRCSSCGNEWATSEIEEVIIPEHEVSEETAQKDYFRRKAGYTFG